VCVCVCVCVMPAYIIQNVVTYAWSRATTHAFLDHMNALTKTHSRTRGFDAVSVGSVLCELLSLCVNVYLYSKINSRTCKIFFEKGYPFSLTHAHKSYTRICAQE